MKKVFLVPLLTLVLTACGASTPTDFNSLYSANIKASYKQSDEAYGKAFARKAVETVGNVKGAIEMVDPTGAPTMSTTFSTDYSSVTAGGMQQVTLTSPKLVINSQESENQKTGEISAKSVELLNSVYPFVKYSDVNISENLPSETEKADFQKAVENIKKYADKWIAFDQSNAMPKELMEKIAKLATLTNDDIQAFLVNNPVFLASGEPKVDGSKYTYNVVLNTEKFTKIVQEFVKTPQISEEQLAEVAKFINRLELSGTITYDAKNPLFVKAEVVLKDKETPNMSVKFTQDSDKEKAQIAAILLNDNTELGRLVIDEKINGKEANLSVKIALTQLDSMEEVFTLSALVKNQQLETLTADVKLAMMLAAKASYVRGEKLTVAVDTFGMTNMFKFENIISGDNHTGKMLIQNKEVANWVLVIKDDKLNALKLLVKNLASGFSTEENLLEVDVKKENNAEMATGKTKVNLGGLPIVADTSLQAEKTKFGLMIQNVVISVPNTEGQEGPSSFASPLKKFEIFTTYETKDTNKTVPMPPQEFVTSDEFMAGMPATAMQYSSYDELNTTSEDAVDTSAFNLSEEEEKALAEALKDVSQE